MAIIVFQHSDANRPGRLGLTLRDHAMKLEVVRLDRGEPVPADYDDVDGVISLGGPQRPDSGEPWIGAEMGYLRGAHERGLPVVGVCLGHELLGVALGGEVGPLPEPEIGMVPVEILPAGQTDTLLCGMAWTSHQLLSHEQQVTTPPPGAVVLARSQACTVQAFRAGMRSYGFQFHFEADRAIAGEIASESAEMLERAQMSAKAFTEQLEAHEEMFGRLADRLCLNIATFLFPKLVTKAG